MKKAIMQKLVAVMLLIIMGICMASAQTKTVKHTVGRGETLSSIAKRYGTTNEKIIELNPDASQFIYVGMELTVPVSTISNNSTFSTSSETSALTPKHEYKDEHKMSVINKCERKTEYEILVGVSLNNYVGEDCDDFSMKVGFNAAFAARYYLIKDLFIESGLGLDTKGYRLNYITSSGPVWDDYGPNYDSEIKTVMSTYNLDLPILIGYRLNLSGDLNLKVKVGPYITYALSGEKTEKGYTTIYTDIHSSETEYIDSTTKLKDLTDFKNFGFGLNVGVDVNFKSFVFSAKFQRGLSEIYKESKEYEQNILLSVGYHF